MVHIQENVKKQRSMHLLGSIATGLPLNA